MYNNGAQTQMRINKNPQQSQRTLRRRTKSSPRLSYSVRGASTILISLFVVVGLFLFQVGVYIRDKNLWKSFTIPDMEEHFKCEEAFATTRPWWTSDQWREVRDLYQAFAQENRGTYQMADDNDTFDFSEIAEPFHASEEKGRGLRAARDIHEGELVLRITNNTIVITDGFTYRKFMFAVEERFPTFACDIMIWNWCQDLDDEGETFGMVVDLNDNNLLNTGDEEADANVWCGTYGEEDSCDMKNLTFYAARDIRKGEELLGDYGEFVSYHSRDELGL